MDSIIHITQQMSQAKRAEVARILEAFDSTKPTNGNGNGNGNDCLNEWIYNSDCLLLCNQNWRQ